MSSPPRRRHVPFVQRHVARLFAAGTALGPRLARWESSAVAGPASMPEGMPPAWICGMARSGSTVLLELVAAIPGFTTHRYADYPFLWTPYWWNHLRSRVPRGEPVASERAHRDRLAVTPDSPEAFEELFWMHFFPGRHDAGVSQVLDASSRCEPFERFFDEHRRKLLAVRGASRYVAKANAHLPRLGYLHARHPGARFVIPVRDPVAQVASLVKQDRLFLRLHEEDPEVGAHLSRIGHHEFGPYKRAVHLGDAAEAASIMACFADGRVVEGYARQWAALYGFAAKRMEQESELADASLWIAYERLCADPVHELGRLAAHLSLPQADAVDLVDRGTARLSMPDYYRSDLTPEDEERVRALCGPTWAALERWAVRAPLSA